MIMGVDLAAGADAAVVVGDGEVGKTADVSVGAAAVICAVAFDDKTGPACCGPPCI